MRRLYRDAYDAALQSDMLGDDWYADDAMLGVTFLGAVRLDTLLCEKLVFADSQLLFSPCFLAVAAPQAGKPLLSELPADAVELAVRADDIEATILSTLAPPGASHFSPIVPECLPGDTRTEVAQALKAIPTRGVTTLKDVLKAYDAAGVDPVTVGRLEEAWRRLDESKAISLRPWPKYFDWRSAFLANLEFDREAIESLLPPEVLSDLEYTHTTRGTLYIRLAEMERSGRIQANDVALLKSWYAAAYHRAIAQQHNCDTQEISTFPSAGAYTSEHRRFDREWAGQSRRDDGLTVTPEFIHALGRVANDRLKNFMDDPLRKDRLRKWWYDQDQRSLQDVAEQMVELANLETPWEPPGMVPECLLPPLRLLILGIPIWAASTALAAGIEHSLGDQADYMVTAFEGAAGAAPATFMLDRWGKPLRNRLTSRKTNFARRIVYTGRAYLDG